MLSQGIQAGGFVDFVELAAAHRGGRSLSELMEASGGVVARSVWQQWVNPAPSRKPSRSFPSPETMRGMAKALGVTETEVLVAFGVTLGMDVAVGVAETDLLVPGAGHLPEEAKAAIGLVAAMLGRQARAEGV